MNKCLINKCLKESHTKQLCQYHYHLDYRTKNKEKLKSKNKQWRANNAEVIKSKQKARREAPGYYEKFNASWKDWYKANPEKHAETIAAGKARNPERHKEIQRLSRQRNPEAGKAKLAKRRALKKNAMPDWVNTKELTRIYFECPKGMHIDHIIPLVNENICGLHVPQNLQYLTVEQNQFKSNKFDGN